MKRKNRNVERKINMKVVILSVVGLVSLALAYFVNWMFIGISAIVILLNQKELMKN